MATPEKFKQEKLWPLASSSHTTHCISTYSLTRPPPQAGRLAQP